MYWCVVGSTQNDGVGGLEGSEQSVSLLTPYLSPHRGHSLANSSPPLPPLREGTAPFVQTPASLALCCVQVGRLTYCRDRDRGGFVRSGKVWGVGTRYWPSTARASEFCASHYVYPFWGAKWDIESGICGRSFAQSLVGATSYLVKSSRPDSNNNRGSTTKLQCHSERSEESTLPNGCLGTTSMTA